MSFVQIRFYRPNGDLGCQFLWKPIHTCRKAATGKSLQPKLIGLPEARTITVAEVFEIRLRHPVFHDRSDRMKDVPAGQIVCARDFDLSIWFKPSRHESVAIESDLYSRVGMDDIVYTVMQRMKASQQS